MPLLGFTITTGADICYLGLFLSHQYCSVCQGLQYGKLTIGSVVGSSGIGSLSLVKVVEFQGV